MSARRFPLVIVLALVLVMSIEDAHAWAPIDSSRPVWSGPVPYAMHEAGSADLGMASSEMVTRQGMDDWSRVSCTSLTTNYRGRTATRPGLSGGGDGESVIGWVESGWAHESGAIGVTGPRWFRSILEADMQLNGQNYTWITGSGGGSSVDAYSILLHEGGHYYGLGHSSDPRATMYYAYGGGIASLAADDQNGICALYPGSGSDCTTTGCPAGQMCEGGSCVPTTGDGNVCAPCSSSSDCAAGGVCLQYPDGAGYCGRACSSSSACGADQCVNITGVGGQCVRVRGISPSCSSSPSGCTTDSMCSPTQRCNTTSGACEPRPASGGPLGAACGASEECSTGLCFAGTCSQSCDWLHPGSACPSGYYCSGPATGSCGASGVCLAGGPGAGTEGDACSAATDCASLYCASGRCSTPCIPGGAAGCPDGSACQVGAVAGCGSCQRSGALGDPCAVNEDCTSSICASLDEDGFCTQFCEGSSCPSGFHCVGVTARLAVCQPDSGTLGAACTGNADCLSGICADEGEQTYCTRLCDGRSNPCPGSGFACVETDDPSIRVCRPVASGGCGCHALGMGLSPIPGALGVWAMLGLLIAWRRRGRA